MSISTRSRSIRILATLALGIFLSVGMGVVTVSAQEESNPLQRVQESIGRLNEVQDNVAGARQTITETQAQVVANQTQVSEDTANVGDIFDTIDNPLFSLVRSRLPVILIGETVSLEQPAQSVVIMAGQNGSINAPVNGDVYALVANLEVNASISGLLTAATTQAAINEPTKMQFYSPFALGRLLWLNVIQPATQEVRQELEARQASQSAELVEATMSATLTPTSVPEAPTETEIETQTETQPVLQLPLGFLENLLNRETTTPTPTSTPTPELNVEEQTSFFSSFKLQLVAPVMAQGNEEAVTETSTQDEVEAAASTEEDLANETTFLGISMEDLEKSAWQFMTIVLTAWILVGFVPKFILTASKGVQTHLVASTLWGLVGLIVLPVTAVILLFTRIGLSISLILLLLYGIGILLANVVVTLALGERLASYFSAKNQKSTWLHSPFVWSVFGAVIVAILVNLPWIGGLLQLIMFVAGFGAALLWLKTLGKSSASEVLVK